MQAGRPPRVRLLVVHQERREIRRWQTPKTASALGVIRWVAVCVALWLLASLYVYSWVPSNRYEGEPVKWRWRWPVMTLYTDSLGPKYTSAAKRALEAWGYLKNNWRFSTQETTSDTYVCYSDLDSYKSVAFGDTYCGLEFGPSTLAITATVWDPDFVSLFDRDGFYKDADVIFNSKDWSWDVYSGPWRDDVADFNRVAIHEFGHVIGLDHPDENGQSRDAIMNSRAGDTEDLQLDDVLGIGGLRYGGSYRPDLVVGKPTASGNLVAGQDFDMSAVVRNRGNHALAAGSTEVRYEYLDFSGSFPVWLQSKVISARALPAGASTRHTGRLRAPDEAGNYSYRVCVDEVVDEANTNNNCSEVTAFRFETQGPDLIVEEVRPSANTLTPNEVFTLSTRLRNGGDEETPRQTTLRYHIYDGTAWRSLEYTHSVPALGAGQSWQLGLNLRAPLDAGTYRYAACVDILTGETDTNNNCATAEPVTVTGGSPDLVVSSVSVDDNTLGLGESTFVNYTVQNQGNGATAGSPQVTAFRSADPTIWWDDTSIGTATHVSIDSLGVGQTVSSSMWMPAAPSAGTWYYGACVHGEQGESDTTNNCSTGVPVTVAGSGSDRAVLEALYNATNGARWTNSANWNTNAPLDQWVGVSTDADGRVFDLVLGNNNLTGSIPSSLGNLQALYNLVLDGNQLTGEIPASLGNLSNLRWLWLSNNQLTGEIPDALGNLTNLEDMVLGQNGLTGEIPATLGNLSGLTLLGLDNNELTGEIPAALGNLTNLVFELRLDNNRLTGSIPPALGNLTELLVLYLNGNQLTGTIPAELGNMVALSLLQIDNDTGLCLDRNFPLATPFAQLTLAADLLVCGAGGGSDRAVLEALYNATNGARWTNSANWNTNAPLDQWVGVSTDADGRVFDLVLGNNNLTGSIPSSLGNLQALYNLVLDGNQLTGEIPASLGNLSNLRWLWLSNNQLTGEIPDALGNLTNLEDMVLGQNGLTGEIPATLGNLSGLTLLGLDNNELTGEIPAALGNLTNLVFELRLDNNRLTGSIPPALGNLTELLVLYLNGNQLTGTIPAELGNMVALSLLQIDNDTGLCLDRNFPLATPFGQLTLAAGILVCGAGGGAFTDDPIVAGETPVRGGALHRAARADRHAPRRARPGPIPVDGLDTGGRGHAGPGRPYVGASDRARAGVRRGEPDHRLRYRAGAGGLGNSR